MVDTARKLKLLYIAPYFPPSAAAGVHRMMRVCRYLPKDRFEIDVLTRNLGSDPGGEELLRQVPDGVSVYRADLSGGKKSESSVRIAKPENVEAKKKSPIKTYLQWLINPLRNAKELIQETPDKHVGWCKPMLKLGKELCSNHSYDLLMTSGPPHSIHLVGLQLKKETGTPWVADFRDPWARRPWDVPHNPWGQWLLPKYERNVISNASAVLLNTTATLQDFVSAYSDLSKDKFQWVPNGMDPELPAIVENLLSQRASTSRKGSEPLTLCHAGSLYGNRRPDGLFDAMSLLQKQGVECRLLQIGIVDDAPSMVAHLERLGIRQLVEFIPRIPHAEVLRIMAGVDLHVVLQPDGPFMIPGKVYEMIAYPQPIVAICDSPVTIEVVEKAGGTHAASRDPIGIAKAIQSAARMIDDLEFNQKRIAARNQFDGRQIVERLGLVLEAVSKRKDAGVPS